MDIVVGTETEIPTAHITAGPKRLASGEVSFRLIRQVSNIDPHLRPPTYYTREVWQKNGGCFSVDGDLLEWATPECTNAFDVVAYEQAGVELIRLLHPLAEEKLASDDLPGQIWIAKNNCTPSSGNSWGCHENYMAPTSTPQFDSSEALLDAVYTRLVPFLIVRQLLCGAGKLGYHNPKMRSRPGYQIAQRPDFIYQSVAGSSTIDRPMINPRPNDPLCNGQKFQRIHLIVGDSNRSPWSSFFKIATTQLFLKMFLDDYCLPDISFHDPVASLRHVSYDLSLSSQLLLSDGATISARQLLRKYLHAAQDYLGSGGTHSEKFLLSSWAEVQDELDGWHDKSRGWEQPPTVLERRLDWCIKLRTLRKAIHQYDLRWDSPRLALLELNYHDLRPGYDIYLKLVDAGEIDPFPDWQREGNPLTCPPPDTRASLRGHAVAVGLTVSWERVKLRDDTSVEMGDPLDFEVAVRAVALREARIPFPTDHPLVSRLSRWPGLSRLRINRMSLAQARHRLDSNRWDQRRTAVHMLARHDVCELIDVMVNHPSRQTRHDAVSLILIQMRRGDRKPLRRPRAFLRAVLKLMNDDAEDRYTCLMATQLLAKTPLLYRDRQLAIDALRRALKSELPAMRIAAISSLVACAGDEASEYIAPLKDDTVPEVRAAVRRESGIGTDSESYFETIAF